MRDDEAVIVAVLVAVLDDELVRDAVFVETAVTVAIVVAEAVKVAELVEVAVGEPTELVVTDKAAVFVDVSV